MDATPFRMHVDCQVEVKNLVSWFAFYLLFATAEILLNTPEQHRPPVSDTTACLCVDA